MGSWRGTRGVEERKGLWEWILSKGTMFDGLVDHERRQRVWVNIN